MPVIGWVLLLFCLVASALSLVHSKHLTRKVFTDIQNLERTIEGHQIEWGQLQLELETWAAYSRVEAIARQQLKMVMPNRADTRYIRP